MQTVLIVVHLMIVLALVGVVLIQRSEGGGLGIGGGSGFMSARGTANALTRTTAILAVLFFVTSLGLGLLARYQAKPTDILDRLPTTTTTDGLLDSLGPAKTNETPADPNAIPLGDDQSSTTPAVNEQTPAAATTTEEKPAAVPTDTTPAETVTPPAAEEQPVQPQ
ncbi:MAG: preprotein translocase subunit SecG [Rhizobium sp.]|nr:preprotein translocase subunit SecG [Rhizobium sp.]